MAVAPINPDLIGELGELDAQFELPDSEHIPYALRGKTVDYEMIRSLVQEAVEHLQYAQALEAAPPQIMVKGLPIQHDTTAEALTAYTDAEQIMVAISEAVPIIDHDEED